LAEYLIEINNHIEMGLPTNDKGAHTNLVSPDEREENLVLVVTNPLAIYYSCVSAGLDGLPFCNFSG
jgi:hypothetical protein